MPSSAGKAYLVAYNAAQFLGWSYMLYLSVPHYLKGDAAGLWAEVGGVLKLFQTAAALEILHAAVGLVRSSVFLTGFQVFSRVAVTWAVVHSFPEAQSCPGFPTLLLAWQVTEVVRYPFYAFGLLGSVPSLVTWLRYTFFIFLYPMGVTGEVWCGISCLDRLYKERRWSTTMPNAWNYTFDAYAVAILLLLSYFPIFPQLYFHMFAQRKKVIGGDGGGGKKDN